MFKLTCFLLAAILLSGEDHPPCSAFELPHYTAYRTTAAPLIDGQLDECDLTLKDLEKIANVFTHILTGIYHTRVEYPDDSDIKKP